LKWTKQKNDRRKMGSVAARLAGGGVIKIAAAGKPDCYRASRAVIA
jgi:hypothetical protein